MTDRGKITTMDTGIKLNDIVFRTILQQGDIGYITHLHGTIYKQEYNYGIAFETYVAAGLAEFYRQYDPQKDGVWICEHENKIIGFLVLMHRDNNSAQLRYFLLVPAYRGWGIGKKMMQLFMSHLTEKGFQSAYLWTTNEQGTAGRLYKSFGFELVEEKYSEAFGKPLYEQKYTHTVR
jgi:N-acetylglutamate synthase-like GNAT family acetyltransferase